MDTDSWAEIDSAVEYKTGWYTGGYDKVRQPDGSTKKYYWASLPPAVVIVAVTPENEVVFVEQYRPTIKEQQDELPAGIVDEHSGASDDQVRKQDYIAAAKRELREETGYIPGKTELIQDYAVATGVLRHRRGIVFADQLESGTPERDTNEFLSVKTGPAEKAVDVAREPPTNDATINGLLLAKEEGLLSR